MRMAYVVGTFSAHPAVMGAMNEFLRWVVQPATAEVYDDANRQCAAWVQATNRDLVAASMPVRLMNLGTVWTVLFKAPGRYNWLLQYYLRAEGVTLSWVGTGRCLSSLDFTPDDYRALQLKIIAAVKAMRGDDWWLEASKFPQLEKQMRRRLIREMAGSLVQAPAPLRAFHAAVMQRKHDDHHASHSHAANQALHLVSSSVFLYCYAVVFSDLTTAMCVGLAALVVRQFGHAVIEPACHEEEKLLLGYTTRDKTAIVLGYLLVPVIDLARAGAWSLAGFTASLDLIALHWFRWTVFVVALRVVYLVWKYDFRISMIWFVKLVTDPMTDIVAYFPRWPQRA